MLRGEAITWLYTMALLDAVYMVQQDAAKQPDRAQLSAEYTKQLRLLQPTMPEPKRCKDNFHCDHVPTCFTDYKPHYSTNMTLSELVVGTTKWVYEPGKCKSTVMSCIDVYLSIVRQGMPCEFCYCCVNGIDC